MARVVGNSNRDRLIHAHLLHGGSARHATRTRIESCPGRQVERGERELIAVSITRDWLPIETFAGPHRRVDAREDGGSLVYARLHRRSRQFTYGTRVRRAAAAAVTERQRQHG